MIALGPRVLDEFLVPQLEAYILRIAEQMQQATNTANTAVLVRRTSDLKVSHLRHFDFDQGAQEPGPLNFLIMVKQVRPTITLAPTLP